MGSEKKGRPYQVSNYRAGDETEGLDLRSSRRCGSAFSLPVASERATLWSVGDNLNWSLRQSNKKEEEG